MLNLDAISCYMEIRRTEFQMGSQRNTQVMRSLLRTQMLQEESWNNCGQFVELRITDVFKMEVGNLTQKSSINIHGLQRLLHICKNDTMTNYWYLNSVKLLSCCRAVP